MKKETARRISELIASAVNHSEAAGLSLLVVKDDREIFFDAAGFANEEEKKPYRRDSIVRLFSMSKPVTSAAALILMERGLLDPAQPVADLLPGFKADHLLINGERVSTTAPVTVYHLLNMTAGITYGDLRTDAGRQVLSYLGRCQANMHRPGAVSTREFAIGLGQLPLAYEPGTSWSYGLCADVLGAVIEEAAGEPFGEFLSRNIFEPLGMKDTGFYVPDGKRDRLADAYIRTGPGQIKPFTGDNLVISYRMSQKPAFESGGAGLVSTIDDYARFARMLLRGGELNGKRIMSPQTVSYMTGGCLTGAQQEALHSQFGLEGFTYANLLRIKSDRGCYTGLTRPGEYGWDGWMGCYFANFPLDNVFMILTMQLAESGTEPITRKIRNVLLSDEEIFM